jgi:arginine-tRNA-protein transferase
VQLRWTSRTPRELVVYDEPHPCPYLPEREARLPMRLPTRPLTLEEVDQRLSEGDRRHGAFLYRPSCPRCTACEPLRLDAMEFVLSATHRRVLRRGDATVSVELGEPRADDERVALYEKHKRGRGLADEDDELLDRRGYEGFLVERSVPSLELRYRVEGKLVGVAVTDRGQSALSAVYCLWDPDHARLSLGTYSILKQLELCRAWGLRHLYLGLYVAGNEPMAYKARFFPHERLLDGRWTRVER